MDHPMKRRPLKTVRPLGEPNGEDRHTNANRRLKDKLGNRRFFRRSDNAAARRDYHARIPQAQDARRRRPNDESGPKRKAPDKRLGTRLRRR